MDTRFDDAIGNSPQFPSNKSMQPFQFGFARGIVLQELIGQSNRSQRQAHRLPNVTTC